MGASASDVIGSFLCYHGRMGNVIEFPGNRGGEGEVERQESSIENSSPAELSPEQEITETFQELAEVDQEIFTAEKSIAETDATLASLREEMGVPGAGEPSPAIASQKGKIIDFQKRKAELEKKKDAWIELHGKEKIPEGLVFTSKDGGREARGGSPDKRAGEQHLVQGISAEEKERELESRKEWLKQWEAIAVQQFEKAMRDDWYTQDAMNLDVAIELMKLRVPKAMEQRSAQFLDGTLDAPPFSAVWIKWETGSLLNKILARSNAITKLEILFDDDPVQIVGEGEFKQAAEQQQSAAEVAAMEESREVEKGVQSSKEDGGQPATRDSSLPKAA